MGADRAGRPPYDVLGHRIPGTDLANVNPFRLAAEVVAGKTKDPGDLTVVVVGVRVDREDQFLILASYAKAPHAWWPGRRRQPVG